VGDDEREDLTMKDLETSGVGDLDEAAGGRTRSLKCESVSSVKRFAFRGACLIY
jgi:hypothetical protein